MLGHHIKLVPGGVYRHRVASTPATFDPEAGLTLTTEVPVGATIPMNSAALDTNSPVVLAADFTGLDGVTSPGLICELGGSSNGAVCGFASDGTFILRCGSGGAEWPSGCAYITAAPGTVHGDGTLVAEFAVPGMRAWWNGVQLSAYGGSFSGKWAGTNDGAYLNAAVGTIPKGSHVTAQAAGYTTASALRNYKAQTVTA